MKSYSLPGIFAIMLFAFQANAQLNKVEKTIDDIESGKRTIDKIRGWIPKKSKTDSSKAQGAATGSEKSLPAKGGATTISITGIEFSKLKTFTENIKACAIVQSATMKYNSVSSSIEVQHTGTTDALLKLMGETSKDIFSENNIESFEEGKINLKLNK